VQQCKRYPNSVAKPIQRERHVNGMGVARRNLSVIPSVVDRAAVFTKIDNAKRTCLLNESNPGRLILLFVKPKLEYPWTEVSIMSVPTGVASVAVDPPVPNRMTRITPPPAAVQAKDNLKMAIMAASFIAVGAVCFWMKHSVAGYVLGALGLVFFISIFSKKTDVGQCPYCMAQFRDSKLTVKDGLMRCEQCGEYSQIANRTVKPLDPTTYANSPRFESALFKQGSMPNVCANCGAPATRLDTVSTSSLNKTLAVAGAARLMTGAPGLAVFSNKQASVSIPYCDQHRDAVALSFDWRKKPILTWCSLRLMRRYLAVNRGKEEY